MNYQTATQDNIASKKVILRLDLDVPIENQVVQDNLRLKNSLDSLSLTQKSAKTLILGHRGRPDGFDPKLSLKPVIKELKRLIDQDIHLLSDLKEVEEWLKSPITYGMLENTRFFPWENQPQPNITRKLSTWFDVYINDSFATAHRTSTTTTELAKAMNSFLGLHFKKELDALSRVVDNPIRPITIILGGKKTDKIENVDNFSKLADNVLIGGKITSELTDQTISNHIHLASLTPGGYDISPESVREFSEVISASKTIVWNGPMGKFEDDAYMEGTAAVAKAIAESKAFSIIGGGDTLSAIKKLNLEKKFDHLSSGGGSLLYYLAHSSLPALDAIKNK